MTFVGHNPADAVHTVDGHPEHAGRVRAILEALDRSPFARKFPRVRPDRELDASEATRVHTMRLWLNLQHLDDGATHWLDPDTYMVQGSRRAALTTARLAVQAVARARTEDEAGFVVARPPGHHATPDRSMGFCLLNNVAVAARAALDAGLERILIFDHDVHHGNGTQDAFWTSDRVVYQSFHLSPHYPGTGSVDEVGQGPGAGFTANAPLSMGDGDEAVRGLLEAVFLPMAREFNPDLILFSSGFDSLAGDPLGGLRLSPGFYGELARGFRRVCPRIVAFLEGGYQVDVIPRAALALLEGLDGRPLDTEGAAVEPPVASALRTALSPYWNCLR